MIKKELRFVIVNTPDKFKTKYTSPLMIYDNVKNCYYNISPSTQFALMNGIPVNSIFEPGIKSTEFKIQ